MAAAPENTETKPEFDVDLIGIEFGSSAIKLCCYKRNGLNITPSSVGKKGVINLVDYTGSNELNISEINKIMVKIFGTPPNPVPQEVREKKKTIYVTDFVSNGHYLKTLDKSASLKDAIEKIKSNLQSCKEGLSEVLTKYDLSCEFKEYQEFKNVNTETLQTALNFEGEFEIDSANTAIDKYNSSTSLDKRIPRIEGNSISIFTGGESTQIKKSDDTFLSKKTTKIGIEDFNYSGPIDVLYLCSNMAFLVFDYLLYIKKDSLNENFIDTKEEELTAYNKKEKILKLEMSVFKELLKEMIDPEQKEKKVGEDEREIPFQKMPGYNLLGILQKLVDLNLKKLVELKITGNVYIFKGLPNQKIGAITGLMNKLNGYVSDKQRRVILSSRGGYKKVKSKKRKSTKKSKKRKSTKKPTRKSRKRKSTKKSKKKKSSK